MHVSLTIVILREVNEYWSTRLGGRWVDVGMPNEILIISLSRDPVEQKKKNNTTLPILVDLSWTVYFRTDRPNLALILVDRFNF